MKSRQLILGLSLSTLCYTANVNAKDFIAKKVTTTKQVLDLENPVFADAKINSVYQHYIHLKTALVNNDLTEAENGTEMLNKALKVAGLTLKGMDAMIEAKEVKTKRAAFDILSLGLTDILKNSKIESGVVYKQFCPMANNGKGGNWLASEAKIQNPYYGKNMMGCGSVKEEIK
ncbi:MAG: DUF3347 domain-containing protein [Oligoflexus sp.]|nr:DUF3347 domain-containing protein [Pseudopedobacter sp.]